MTANPSDQIALVAFTCTLGSYIILFALGRKWKREFLAKGTTYWSAPKDKRIKELTSEVWQPIITPSLYGLAYFAEGYVRSSIAVWLPFFLIQMVGATTLDVSLFLGIMYLGWSWKTFFGMANDATSISWAGKRYRRRPWFIISGLVTACAVIPFIFYDPVEMPVWTFLLPVITAIITADAILDVSIDAYMMDVTPPERHAWVLGSVAYGMRAVGSIVAMLLPLFLLEIGGYRLIFLSSGLAGLLAFPCVLLKEPRMEQERLFSKRAIAFTFTEKSVLIVSIMCMFSISAATFTDPTGGMFSLVAKTVVGISPELTAQIGVVAMTGSFLGYMVCGRIIDRWGHKRSYIAFSFIVAAANLLLTTLGEGTVIWFTVLMASLCFITTFPSSARTGLQGDLTPLGLSSTVFQMYWSLTHMVKIITSAIIGTFLPISLALCITILVLTSLASPIIAIFIKPYDAATGTKI